MEANLSWRRDHRLWLELFALLNRAGLPPDIYLAHSTNSFRHPPETMEWPLWVLLLALGGFAGNFIFSLTDHAQNGFFHRTEWIPVISSAFAVGFLLVPLITRIGRPYLIVSSGVMSIQAAVGLL